jgi:hypothetical protein
MFDWHCDEGGAARSCVTINNIKFTVSLRQIVIS